MDLKGQYLLHLEQHVCTIKGRINILVRANLNSNHINNPQMVVNLTF